MSEFISPPEVLEAYYPDGIVDETVLTGGSVNTTLLINDSTAQLSVLQRVSPMYSETMAGDYEVVSKHLQDEGWETPSALKTRDGRAYTSDDTGRLWRSFTYIESDGYVPAAGPEANIALSGLLGSLHNSFGRLVYTPKFSIPHFHETKYYADKLEALMPDHLPNKDVRALGSLYIRLSREQTIPPIPSQLIHGDPKLANALYRGGKPFTFIDFDTLMKANPLIDVGDMLRSVTGKLVADNPSFTTSEIVPVIEAYYERARPKVSEEKFVRQALNAGQVIALELGMRYLVDSVEGEYFSWDKEQFESGSEHNIARAQIQWQTYEALRA